MSKVYKLKGGSASDSWNALIAAVNALVPECQDVDPLDSVTSPHIWSKTDIHKVQDKLKELCDQAEFSAVPKLWKQSIIDELVKAIEDGTCCCEETDKTPPRINTFAFSGGFQIFQSAIYFPFSSDYHTFDWAGWIKQETLAASTKDIPLATGATLSIPIGGPGWVGRQYRSWEAYVEKRIDPPGTPVSTGPIADGYIFIGTAAAKAAAIEWSDALRDERSAIVAQAAAQAARDAASGHETIASTQAALDRANADLTNKTAIREAKEAAHNAAPEANNWPWIVNNSYPHWVLVGQGSGFSLPVSGLGNDLFQRDRAFILDLPDAPWALNTIPVPSASPAAGTLRLLCE